MVLGDWELILDTQIDTSALILVSACGAPTSITVGGLGIDKLMNLLAEIFTRDLRNPVTSPISFLVLYSGRRYVGYIVRLV